MEAAPLCRSTCWLVLGPLPMDTPAVGGGSASGGSLSTGGPTPPPMMTSQQDTQGEIRPHPEALCSGLE